MKKKQNCCSDITKILQAAIKAAKELVSRFDEIETWCDNMEQFKNQ